MAVKKHKLVRHDQKQINYYLQMMTQKPVYLPPTNELIEVCENIVKALRRVNDTEEELLAFVSSIEEFLVYVMNNVDCESRNKIVTAIVEKFYFFISDPQYEASPLTAVVLTVISETDPDAGKSAVRWLVKKAKNEQSDCSIQTALNCLVRWLYEFGPIPCLGNWVIYFIKVLEENDMFDTLISVSLAHIVPLFLAIKTPELRQDTDAEVLLHVLKSMRGSRFIFEQISPYICEVLECLAEDSGNYSRQLLEKLVDTMTAMVNANLDASQSVDEENSFRSQHAQVIECLQRHMSSESTCTNDLQWMESRKKPEVASVPPKKPVLKVGLRNLGNTCYINSIIQALLVARKFSNHVMLKMHNAPYWSNLAVLFAKMIHSVNANLNPAEFVSVAKPPSFTNNTQHDSSEFLGHLFELLKEHENVKHSTLASGNRQRYEEHPDPAHSARSMSPSPGSSRAGSGSKRPSTEESWIPAKRRCRDNDINVSIIDRLFRGSTLTRTECSQCGTSSLCRSRYRELQLSFPEYPEGWQYSVQSLLDYYCSTEILTGDNQYLCGYCKVLCDAERSIIIETTPIYLILVLKNFKYDVKQQVQTKLMHSMLYNTTLTIPTVRSQKDPKTYTLFAAVIHNGPNLDFGHYYTMAKDQGQWYKLDDLTVSLADETGLKSLDQSSTPYILFYRRTDVEEALPPTEDQLPPLVQEKVQAHNKKFARKKFFW